jgi:hypothetical protein
LASLLVLAAGAAPARADGASARAHYERGRSLFQVSEYAKAIEEFKAAHVEKPDPLYLYNIAECHRLLGQTKDALVFYRRFIALAPPGGSLVSDAEKRIAELEHPAATAPAAPVTTPVTAPPPKPAAPRPPPAPVVVPPPAAAPPPAAVAPPPAVPPPALTTAPAIAATPAPPAEHRPFYKHGWFYVVVGAVVVAAAVGTVGVLSSTKGTDVPTTTYGNRSIFGP